MTLGAFRPTLTQSSAQSAEAEEVAARPPIKFIPSQNLPDRLEARHQDDSVPAQSQPSDWSVAPGVVLAHQIVVLEFGQETGELQVTADHGEPGGSWNI